MYALYDGNGLPSIVCADSSMIDEYLLEKYNRYYTGYPTRSTWDHNRYGNAAQYASAYMFGIYILRTPENVNFSNLQTLRNNAINRNYARINFGSQEDRVENQRVVIDEAFSPLGINEVTAEFLEKTFDPVVTGCNVTATISRRGLVNTGAVVNISQEHYRHLSQQSLEDIVEHLRGLRYLRVHVPGRGVVNMAISSLSDFRKNDIVEHRNIIKLTNNIFE